MTGALTGTGLPDCTALAEFARLLLIFVPGIGGVVCIVLGQERQWRAILAATYGPPTAAVPRASILAFRLLGANLIAASLVAALPREGIASDLPFAAMLLCCTAFALIAALASQTRWLRFVAATIRPDPRPTARVHRSAQRSP